MDSYYLCPIYFFEYDGDQIQLPEQVQIIKTPKELIDYLHNRYPHDLPTILSETKWAIAIKNAPNNTTHLNIIKSFSHAVEVEDKAKYKLIDLITTLRLYKEGRIVAGLLTSGALQNSEWSVGGTTIWTPVSNILFFEEKPKYKIENHQVCDLVDLYKKVRNWRKLNILDKIDISLGRFHSSYHGDIENRLIDQMIAFESLYIGDNKELTYKLAMRTAFLLRKRKDHRKIVFDNMKKAYDFRSKIVHGNNPPSRIKLNEIVPKTQNYLRKSLIIFSELMSKGKSLKNIQEKLLDENIITIGESLNIP
ncbi:MAG: hypothetical protein JW845_02660 [Dehalococcoidales bacterium]|nr:hypothetical protein [Dehalococcoidales bacterium]